MVLKYTSKRPDEELDGLQDLEDHFTTGDPENVLAVVEFTRHGIAKTDPSDQWQATIRVKHVEIVTDEEAATVRRLLRERYEKRTGNAPLPIEEPDDPALAGFPEGGDDQ